ncbi:uncharacterized protein LDX57_010799 [Aspergillus melleus]|uniref:uncharacterized protein n=1 Tax=Aspergillus melleus TaxID=138277 RepID=UPI001E8D1F21|nr:uncharacterized protein LDX57_010799 [Aspergillus melleus]KAH8433165.1 hypothetical protein LDX57_010799 [Aspergillus melleus]
MRDSKKRAKIQTTIPAPVEMDDPAPEPVPAAPYPQWDDIPEYPQPEISPYTTKAITITIGDRNYAVPEYFLRPYPAFEVNQWTRIFHLSDIHADVGHTFIHYLYTNTYETTKPITHVQEDIDSAPRAREFHRSMHTYHAARRYGITGLIDLAKTYIRVFDIDVSTLYILSVAREISTSLPGDEVWFWEYIREKLAIAFEDDEAGLRQDIASYGVGRDPFDAFLVSSVLDIYASALPGKVALNGHPRDTATNSEADVSEAYEWDSDTGEEPVIGEPHAIDGPVPGPESPGYHVDGEAVPELETPHSPDPVAMSPSSPSPPPASPPAAADGDYDPWANWPVQSRYNGAYNGPATGVPARLTTLVEQEEQSEAAAAGPKVEVEVDAEAVCVPVDDTNTNKPTDEWDLGFSVPKKKKKRGRYYDIAPAAEYPEPVIEESPLELEPEPEPEPGIPLPEPAVPERAVPPAESPVGNGNGNALNGLADQGFRFYSSAQPVATAE